MEREISENSLEEKTKKLKKWFSDKNNLILFLILLLAFAIRLYYFLQTLNQPVWWDEGEYMAMARAWAFNLDYQFLPVRPVLFSLITAIFFKVHYSEFLPRLFILLCSLVSVAGMYYFGKEIASRRVGLISAFLMSIFYLDLFYTSRLLVGVPSFAFFILSGLFFYKYFKTRSNKMLYIGAVMIAIATLFRITAAAFLFAILIYVLITEHFNLFKRKEYYIAAIIFLIVLSPYIIWGYLQFNGFVITQAGAWNAPEVNYFSNGICNLKSYLLMIPSMLHLPLLIIFILGLLLMYELLLGFDVLFRGENFKLNRTFFLLLLFIVPIISVSLSIGNCYHEDRYIMNSFAGIFIIAGIFLDKSFNFLKKNYKKALAVFLLFLLLFLVAYLQFQHADNLIKSKVNSYSEAKESGIWMRDNSLNSDIVFTSSWPMTTYYSERKVIAFSSSKNETLQLMEDNPDAKYFMLSAFQKSPEWTYSYPQEKNLSVAMAYFADAEKTQPIVVIYNLR